MKKIINHILISLSILCFGFMGFNLTGYCANVLSIAPSAVPTFEAFSHGMASGGFAFGDPVIMTTEALNNINMNLYQLYGYDLVDLSNDVWNSISDPTEWYNNLTKYASGEYTVDGSRVDVSVANRIAQRISQGVLTGSVTAKNLIDTGYRYFSTSVPQWGKNAKQFIIGKVDEATNQIIDVAPTMVTKFTAQGLAAYNQVYNNLIGNGSIGKPVLNKPIFSNTLSFATPEQSVKFFKINSSVPLYFYSYDSANYPYGAQIHLVVSSEYYDISTKRITSSINGTFASPSGTTSINNLYIDNPSSFNLNEKLFYYGVVRFNDSSFGWVPYSPYSLGTLNNVKTLISDSVESSSALSYDYSSSSSLSVALKNQLERLLDKYVDSLTLNRINDIVSSIPIGQEVVGEQSIPVAIPTQEVVDELTGVVEDALTLDQDYALAFDDAYASEVETTPEPEPSPYPENTGTAVPEGFPETPIFDPLVDIVKTPFSFFSIFEPIFQVFGASFNFFTVWLCFPVILIILLIIWALK